jgi:hypothetical protein
MGDDQKTQVIDKNETLCVESLLAENARYKKALLAIKSVSEKGKKMVKSGSVYCEQALEISKEALNPSFKF